MKKQIVKGFKNGRRTATGFICRDFEFKVGETYKCDGSRIKLCMNGFHFYRNPFDLFTYYDMDIDITVAEIQASGFVIDGENKSVCSEIKIIKILNEEELSILGNTANNLGWANTGYRNTGYRNTGNRNTGNRNAGDRNAGSWNKTNRSSGFFNTFECISVFNKPCDISVWNNTIIPNFLYFSSDWNENIRNITIKEIELLCDIPNFNPEIFYEISGLSIDDLYYYEILFRKF